VWDASNAYDTRMCSSFSSLYLACLVRTTFSIDFCINKHHSVEKFLLILILAKHVSSLVKHVRHYIMGVFLVHGS
jgi:hypothetical protein